ncbi:MAG: type 4a pilus biogenesis protein PilO [bacterium]|nr:type 4a pilus biogenesis protein PilO [bacterium]
MNSNIIPTLALIVAAGILFGYVGPTWSGGLADKRAAIASDDQALAAATTYAAQQNQLATARNAIDPTDLSRLVTFLPSSVDNVGLILDLNALAARSGLTLSNIDVTTTVATNANTTAATTRANPVGSVSLALSAVGTYAALQTFLRGVETSRRLLDVQELVVKGSDTGVYTYQMKLNLYWLR